MSPDAPWHLRGGFPGRPQPSPDGRHTSLKAAMAFADSHWNDRAVTITHDKNGEQWVRRRGVWNCERRANEKPA